MGEIISIVYQPQDKVYGKHVGDFIREPLQEATLIAGHGIEGDRKAGRNRKRQLNILSLEWLQGLRPLGYQTKPGSFGEQIIVKGLPLETLQPGDRLSSIPLKINNRLVPHWLDDLQCCLEGTGA